MTDADVGEVTRLLNEYLGQERFKLAPVFSEAEVRHLLVFQEGVVNTYVLDKEGGELSVDLILRGMHIL